MCLFRVMRHLSEVAVYISWRRNRLHTVSNNVDPYNLYYGWSFMKAYYTNKWTISPAADDQPRGVVWPYYFKAQFSHYSNNLHTLFAFHYPFFMHGDYPSLLLRVGLICWYNQPSASPSYQLYQPKLIVTIYGRRGIRHFWMCWEFNVWKLFNVMNDA